MHYNTCNLNCGIYDICTKQERKVIQTNIPSLDIPQCMLFGKEYDYSECHLGHVCNYSKNKKGDM